MGSMQRQSALLFETSKSWIMDYEVRQVWMSAPDRPRSLRMESRRDLRYCEYGITFVLPAFAASGAVGPALAVGLTTRGLFMPTSAERPRTSAGDWGDVGGGTAGTLGDGFSDLRSVRARWRRWMKHRASAVQSSIRMSDPKSLNYFRVLFYLQVTRMTQIRTRRTSEATRLRGTYAQLELKAAELAHELVLLGSVFNGSVWHVKAK